MNKVDHNLDAHQRLNELLAQSKVAKIVYALVMPETEETIDSVFDGNTHDIARGRENFHNLFREAWTQKQDALHESFFHQWKLWTANTVQFCDADFPFAYPTSGASEALREAIHAFAALARKENFIPKIHLFDGEYEGYSAYAAAAGVIVQSHDRRDWAKALDAVGPHDQFYVSQPSAIDGMVWDEFENFASDLNRKIPTASLMLDLTYVGCVGREYQINAEHSNIAAIFFSLSKPAGVYYHRIGGVFSRKEYLGLFGNKWFKNLTSLSIGTAFMQRYTVRELPTKYRSVQQRAIALANRQLGLSLEPADIFLLGVGQPSAVPTDLERYLLRGSNSEKRVRVCLTPSMAHLINPEVNPNVAPRYYERIPE